MKTITKILVVLGFLMALGSTTQQTLAKYDGGLGTPQAPYQIADKADLLELAATTEDYNKCFILTADIDLEGQVFTSAIIAMNTGLGIEFQGTPFTGIFDGNGLKIINFIIDGEKYIGLFGQINSSGSVQHLGIECFDINSISYDVGGLVGINEGSIINCYSTGNVRGDLQVGGLVGVNHGNITNCYSIGTTYCTYYVGGLVGANSGYINNCYSTSFVNGSDSVGGLAGYNGSTIINCYSTGPVSGSSLIGGLVGNNKGNITNCYSTGVVRGSSDSHNVGGLVGRVSPYRGRVSGSFWDIQTSGQTTGAGEGKTTAQMQDINTFLSAGWDFINETANGTCSYWQMPDGGGYPVLSMLNGYIPPRLHGSGTEDDPYIIADANDLGKVCFSPMACYALAGDINLAGITWSMSVVSVFNGVFDGNGFNICNLSANGNSYLGLFSVINSIGQIKNLGLENCTVSGTDEYIGGLAGENRGSVSNCYVMGTIKGSGRYCSYVGGLVGYNKLGCITNCYSIGIVSSDSFVGGLVGYNNYGANIVNCYAMGSVDGKSRVGGLVGENRDSITNCFSTCTVNGYLGTGGLVGNNYGYITNCYSTGNVIGTSDSMRVGGMVGDNFKGSITNCYSTGAVSGDSYVGGLVGKNWDGIIISCYFLVTRGPDNGSGAPLTDEQMKHQASFIDWDFATPVWIIKENIDYPRLRWENSIPVTVAGPNQTVFAWIDGFADVNLDGYASYDDDNDILDFYWSWTIDVNTYEANGVNPTITLPAGNHTIALVVDDGIDLSEPDYCTITVIKAVRGKLVLNPQVIQTKISLGTPNGGSGKWIIATLFILPVPGEQINKEQPLRLYPSGIEAKYQRFYKYGMFQRGPTFAIAFFDKQQVVDDLGLGTTKISVVGEFQSGRFFFGSDNIKIISPKPPNPWRW